jgi:UDP-N-acetyl-L-fucosamine synthase
MSALIPSILTPGIWRSDVSDSPVKKLRLMTILGTRPEIIRLSEVIKKADMYFDHILVHTGQNWDYTLNEIFFEDLGLRAPDHYLEAVGSDLGSTIGNIIAKSYALLQEIMPDALLILGDTNSTLYGCQSPHPHNPRNLKNEL